MATANDKFLLDATLDQTRLAPPLVIEIPGPRWWEGQWPIFIPIAGGQVTRIRAVMRPADWEWATKSVKLDLGQ